nr:hypothetical protein [Tanacetum cinerariifolium]
MIRNKARFVAQGYTQEERIDYDKVFAPVARIEAIRLYLAYASFKDFVVYQTDVKSAFLYGKIEEEVYVCQPLGFENPDFLDRVYKKELCNAFEKLMHEKFHMSSIGELTFFLGLQVKKKKDGIFISQDKYVAKILKKFRSMIGSLMYLTSSRPDIMFVVCAYARYQVYPKVSHLHAVKRIFRYLKGQPKLGLWYPKDSPLDLVACTDSDYVGASLDRKSTTGDDEDDDAVADMNNLDPTIQVSPIPATRIHKDHLLDQVIKDLQSATQTRNMSKNLEEHGFVSTIQQRTTHKDLQNCLFACFLSQEEPKKVIHALKDPSWIEAMQKEVLQFKLYLKGQPKLGLWYLKDSPLDLVACTDNDYAGASLDRKSTTGDEDVHKELGDRLVMAATIASSLEGEQDSGRVKKLEKRNRSRTHKLKRLYKVGLTASVESFIDEESLGEDASKQERRIDAIYTDDEITLVNDADNEMLDEEAVKRLQAKFDEEERLVREGAKKEQEANIALIETYDDIQAKIDGKHIEDIKIELVKGKEKRLGEELIQESTKKQKVEDDNEKVELKQLMETILDEEEVAIDAIPLAVKSSRIIYMLVEKKYPLTPPTLSMMLEKKLQIDYESKMAYQLCKLIKKQLKKLGDSKPFDTLAGLGSCVNIIPLYLFKKLNIGLLEESNHIFRLADETKSYHVGIVKDVEVHIGKLKLLNDFYVIDMKKDSKTPLLVGRGFLATTNAVIDCRMAKIVAGEGITSTDGVGAQIPYYARRDFLDCYFPKEWEIARDDEINPFKDVFVFRRMVEFLGALPIDLKSNMWVSNDLINNPINWNKPPKNGDGSWHAKIRLNDPDGEEYTKTIQSIPTTRKLCEKESPREIIDLDHFYDT